MTATCKQNQGGFAYNPAFTVFLRDCSSGNCAYSPPPGYQVMEGRACTGLNNIRSSTDAGDADGDGYSNTIHDIAKVRAGPAGLGALRVLRLAALSWRALMPALLAEPNAHIGVGASYCLALRPGYLLSCSALYTPPRAVIAAVRRQLGLHLF